MDYRCRIEMLGGLRALQGGRVISRFRSQKTGVLLAYLAYYRERSHPREELIELLWPEMNPDLSRNSLSQSLSSLRHQLEPPGAIPGTVLVADRWNVALNSEACSTDVSAFRNALQSAQSASVRGDTAQEIARLQESIDLYSGEFLPGYYETWCLTQRDALRGELFAAVWALMALKEASGDLDGALELSNRAVAADSQSEEAHYHVIRIYAALRQPQQALRQYRILEKVLQESLGMRPSASTRELVRDLVQRPDADIQPAIAHRRQTVVRTIPASDPVPELKDHQQVVATRLPLQLTSFIGREIERQAIISSMIGEVNTRLVTLTGPGGVGKSRLSLTVAKELSEHYSARVFYVPLAETTSGDQIPGAILGALEIPASTREEPKSQIASSIGTKRTLLVLDNFEQLIAAGDGAAEVVSRLLSASPALDLLISSRRKLGIPGEVERPISPFPLPDDSCALDQLALSPSAQLFVDRAQGVRPDFQLTKGNAASIRELCARLEGLPLAIELAAARAQVLSPAQILQRLVENFDLLVGPGKDPLARHHTLRNTLEWSYLMLNEALQRCIAGMTVFRGGWTLEAAEAVLEDPLMIDHLAELREFSLITTRETADGSIRFGMLETIRSYAAALIAEENRAVLREGHARYWIGFAAEVDPMLTGPSQGAWLARLEAEMDNFRSALNWCIEGPSAENALRLGAAIWRFWHLRAFVVEGRSWLERILAMPGTANHPMLRGRVLNGLGRLAYLQGDYRIALVAHEEALSLCQKSNDVDGVALAVNALGSIDYEEGRYSEAKARFEQALALRHQQGDRFGIGNALNWLGIVHTAECDYVAAKHVLHQSLDIRREIGDQSGMARALNSLGIVARHDGQFADARRLFEESLEIQQQLGDKRAQAGILSNLGLIAASLAERAEAREMFERALAHHEEVGDKWGIATVRTNIGNLLRTEGEFKEARGQLDDGLRIRRELSNTWGIANSLEALGSLDLAEGRIERAISLFAAAVAIRESIGSPIPPSERAEFELELKKARLMAGDDVFERVWTMGLALSVEEACTLGAQAF